MNEENIKAELLYLEKTLEELEHRKAEHRRIFEELQGKLDDSIRDTTEKMRNLKNQQ